MQGNELISNKWKRLTNILLDENAIKLFKSKGYSVTSTTEKTICNHFDDRFELEIIVYGKQELFIFCVRPKLHIYDVNEHLSKLPKVKTNMPIYKNYNIHGAVAYLKAHEESDKYAERNGLWVIRAASNKVSIINQANFHPILF